MTLPGQMAFRLAREHGQWAWAWQQLRGERVIAEVLVGLWTWPGSLLQLWFWLLKEQLGNPGITELQVQKQSVTSEKYCWWTGMMVVFLGSCCGRVCFCGLWGVSSLGLDGILKNRVVGRQRCIWNAHMTTHAHMCCDACVAVALGSCVCDSWCQPGYPTSRWDGGWGPWRTRETWGLCYW